MVGTASAWAAPAVGCARERAIRWAEPRTLSSITMTVTVAPLMMSSFWPAGAGSSMFWPANRPIRASIFSGGIPIRTIGS